MPKAGPTTRRESPPRARLGRARPGTPRTREDAAPRIAPSADVVRGAELGRDVVIGSFCHVAKGARLGRGTRVQSHTSVWSGVTLGEDVFVGPAVTFTNVRRPRAFLSRAPRSARETWDETVVEEGVTLGASCTLVAPVRVGAFAFVAAGAVVAKDVPPHALVAGVPARVVGWVCRCGESLSQRARPPREATCASCGVTTKLTPR